MSFSIPTQETARSTLDRVLGVAVSRRIPDEQRRELGLAIAWLQRLVDCGVKACRFDPPIQVMRTGEIDIHNSDPVLHNTHGFYGRRTAFNVALPDQGVKVTRELPRPGMVRVECDAHGWMLAHVFVADSPYYALTGQDGRYAIANIPPGTYALVTSQSYAGDTEQQVTVKAGEAQTLDIMATLDGILGGAWAAVGKEQLKRLADTLAGWPKDKPVVVFSHNPLYEYYPPWNFWVRDWREVH
jgi:hypothetical protein